jgi:DMSO/TMAO reductase YedYZ molybdopterin-dependent catalytic subunit
MTSAVRVLVRDAVRLVRAPSGRLTNLQVLITLTLTFATGVGAVMTGSAHGRWIVVAHGIGAMVLVLLIPWKTRVVRAGLRRRRVSRWASLSLAALTLLALLFGLGYTTGLIRSVGGLAGMWLHVAVALALVPLVVWHAFSRRTRARRTDLSRRVLLRAGVLGAVGAGLYVGTAAVVDLLALPGTRRRFTGSYETGSFTPAAMPTTIWLADTPPNIDPARWRLRVTDGLGRYEVNLAQLGEVAESSTRRATLDCTSGWYAEQDWTGVPVSRLLRDIGSAQSLMVHSATGYWIRIPVRDLDSLLLATGVGGQALSVGHGFPLRLVAPGRRGYWWVKWVDRIELRDTPSWWQPPFPVT